MRLIDADALQRKICGAKCGCEYEDCGNEGDCAFDHFIFHAPTIEAEPVVRCRDCKHGRKSDHAYAVDTAKPLCECNFMYGPHQWHEYCSWGEWRADDE